MASSSTIESKGSGKEQEYLRVRLDDSLVPVTTPAGSSKDEPKLLSGWSSTGYRFSALDQIEGDGKVFLPAWSTNNHLFNAFSYAYNNHCPLVLRPDDILLSIAMTVAKYIDLDPEAVRACFVTSVPGTLGGDKKKLEVYQLEENWPKFLQQMDAVVEASVTKEGKVVLNAITNDFSTSTDVSLAVSQVQILSAMKSYFSYGFMLGCGMSEVMMLGSVKDWENLGVKYQTLKVALPKLSWWYRWMDIIIGMFVGMRNLGAMLAPHPPASSSSSSSGGTSVPPECVPAEYKEIWKRVVSIIPQGSGGQSHLGGWLHMLAPYATNGSTIVDEKTKAYSPLMPSVEAPPKESKDPRDCYGHQDVLHKFYKGRDWAEVPKSISAITATTDFMGDVAVESGFYGVVHHTVPGLEIPGVRAICGYRISAAKDAKDVKNTEDTEDTEDAEDLRERDAISGDDV